MINSFSVVLPSELLPKSQDVCETANESVTVMGIIKVLSVPGIGAPERSSALIVNKDILRPGVNLGAFRLTVGVAHTEVVQPIPLTDDTVTGTSPLAVIDHLKDAKGLLFVKLKD